MKAIKMDRSRRVARKEAAIKEISAAGHTVLRCDVNDITGVIKTYYEDKITGTIMVRLKATDPESGDAPDG